MKALVIGGTGTISQAVVQLALQTGWDVTVFNRGRHRERFVAEAHLLIGDIHDHQLMESLLKDRHFDVVINFINFEPADIERDLALFAHRTNHYLFISSASIYQKPLRHYLISESTPLSNPYWEYAQNKLSCEQRLQRAYQENGFPMTIIRPSHTYDERTFPTAIRGNGYWSVLHRMLAGKPVPIHGDGSSLWTITHSRDVAKGIVGLMGNRLAIGEAVHMTSDEQLTWNAIYDGIGEVIGVAANKLHVPTDVLCAIDPRYRGPLLGDKANSVVFDNQKIKRLVPTFIATTRFDQGIRESIHYFLSHPEAQIMDEAFDQFCDRLAIAQQQMIQLMKP